MKSTTDILRAGFLALATLATAHAGGEGWTSDFEAAKKQAAAEKKDMLLDFTGSDWCGWCIKLNKEVFSEDAFKTGIKDKLVLVELDFPRDQSKLSAETKAQNKKLQQEFKIQGYPTIMICDATGKPFAKTGYQAGGPEKYVQHLDELLAVRGKRDAAFAAAEKATDDKAKAKSLVEGLKAMDDEIVENCYADVIAKVAELDKDDSTGYVKERKEAAAKKEAQAAEQGKLREFMMGKINPLMKAKDFDKAAAEVDAFIKENADLSDDAKASISLNVKMPGYVEKGDAEGANKFLDELVKTYPGAGLDQHADRIKEMVKKQIEAKAKKSE